jgi:phage tail-like protein
MSALRWLAHGDWAAAQHTGTTVDGGRLVLDTLGAGFARHGVAVLRAGRPEPAQVDSATADRWRRVVVRLAEPVPQQSWLRIWTRVEPDHAVPAPPDPASALGDHAPADTAPGVWRAAAVDALDARVLCHQDGDLWVAVELGGLGATTPAVADLRVETGDDGPVTVLPVVYRQTGEHPATNGAIVVDDGDGALGRYLGLLGAQIGQTSSLIDELPALLSPPVAPDRDDSRWLETLAAWVALDAAQLPRSDADRRETIATAVARHGRRGTRDGLADQVRRETGLLVEVTEPILGDAVWRLDGTTVTSMLGLTTGLIAADPGPPVLDRTAILDGSMLIEPEDAGLPVHGHVAHRICVHVPDATAEQVAAVDAVVQSERPAHVLARTCALSRLTSVPTEIGASRLPDCGPPGLRNDTAYRADVDGPGIRLGAARIEEGDPR